MQQANAHQWFMLPKPNATTPLLQKCTFACDKRRPPVNSNFHPLHTRGIKVVDACPATFAAFLNLTDATIYTLYMQSSLSRKRDLARNSFQLQGAPVRALQQIAPSFVRARDKIRDDDGEAQVAKSKTKVYSVLLLLLLRITLSLFLDKRQREYACVSFNVADSFIFYLCDGASCTLCRIFVRKFIFSSPPRKRENQGRWIYLYIFACEGTANQSKSTAAHLSRRECTYIYMMYIHGVCI